MSYDFFPTPRDLHVDRGPLIQAAAMRIGAQLRAQYRGGCTYIDITSDEFNLRGDLTSVFAAKGWTAKFNSDQRDGTSVSLTPIPGSQS